ncbi:MAG TPA: UPF0149 family protein [Gammaproteobacteria bacterium]|nr:UPF0149 family protein [Gammaproteobacteria bacterium]
MSDAIHSMPVPDYDEVGAALREGGSYAEAAECQGHLCGVLCVRGTVDRTDWLANTLPDLAASESSAGGAAAVVAGLYDYTRQGLVDPTLDFQLVLPDDGTGIAERTHALGEWCQGFLGGLAESGLRDFDGLPGELPEITHDLVEIAQAGRFEVQGDEEDEAAYAELVEYVRMAVLLMLEELQPNKTPPGGETALH